MPGQEKNKSSERAQAEARARSLLLPNQGTQLLRPGCEAYEIGLALFQLNHPRLAGPQQYYAHHQNSGGAAESDFLLRYRGEV